MNNIDTVAHMNMHYTQYWAHWALFIDAQLCHIAPVAQDRLARVIPSMHVHLCVALWLISLHPSPVFYFVPLLFFQPFQMSSSEFHGRFRSNPLCDFRLGTVATSDHETPLTQSEGKSAVLLQSGLNEIGGQILRNGVWTCSGLKAVGAESSCTPSDVVCVFCVRPLRRRVLLSLFSPSWFVCFLFWDILWVVAVFAQVCVASILSLLIPPPSPTSTCLLVRRRPSDSTRFDWSGGLCFMSHRLAAGAGFWMSVPIYHPQARHARICEFHADPASCLVRPACFCCTVESLWLRLPVHWWWGYSPDLPLGRGATRPLFPSESSPGRDLLFAVTLWHCYCLILLDVSLVTTFDPLLFFLLLRLLSTTPVPYPSSYTYLRNVQDLWYDGKTPYEGRFKPKQKAINLERKSYLDCSFEMHCTREEFGRGDVLVADLEELETMDASENYSKNDSMRKRWYFRSRRENIHLDTGSSNSRRKCGWFSRRIRECLFHHLKTHFWMQVKRKMISGPSQETSLTAITLTQESNFTRQEKNHSLFHWSTLTLPELLIRIWMSSKRSATTTSELWCFKWFVWFVDRFHSMYSIGRKIFKRQMWSRRRLTRKQLPSRSDNWWPALWLKMERMPSWKRNRSGHLKSSTSITHEHCEASTSLIRWIRNSRKPFRKLARNLKHQ